MENDTPFLCVYCMLKSQRDEIATLKSTFKELQETITTLQKKVDGLVLLIMAFVAVLIQHVQT